MWALGLRLRDAKDTDVEQAFNAGSILRTHVMRPTWHFVTPDDIRWLLELTAPRVNALNAYYYRKLELDEATLARSNDVLARALEGGKHLTRAEIATRLQQAGIATQGALRFGYILHRAELDAIVCSGPRKGKQFTYALLDERAPGARRLERDEALAELTLRYFTAHGPATLKDYAWWSGLTAADAKAGLEMVKDRLVHEVVDGRTYWFAESTPLVRDPSPTAYLLPNYDEYVIGYSDRSATFDETRAADSETRDDIYFGHMIVIDGQIVGAWKRAISKGAVVVTTQTFARLTEAQSRAVAGAASRYAEFVGMPVTVNEG